MRAGRYGLIFLTILIIIGFYFRYTGIVKNLSYWNDEGHVAIYARGLEETGKAINTYGQSTGYYQLLMYSVTAISFKLFGVTEFAGRLPSVIIGTVLIAAIYIVSRRSLGKRAALISAFLMTFAQMQLAWSTQLRPYIWLELATLCIVYLCYKFMRNTDSFFDLNIVWAGLITVFAVLFHASGLMNVPIIGFAVVYKSISQKKYAAILYTIPLALIFVAAIFLIFRNVFEILLRFDTDILHYRIFITQNYKWLIAGAAVGGIGLFRRDKSMSILLAVSVALIFAMAIFKINSQFVRYSLPAFPLLYMLFSYGVVIAADMISSHLRSVPLLLSTAILMVLVTGYLYKKDKIVMTPKYYYTINHDMRENPIVDYKKAFAGMKQLIGTRNDILIVDSWNDRVPWYIPGRPFVFASREKKIKIDPQFGEKMIRTVDHFEAERTRNNAGIVLVENWESQMIPELQDHIRKTLKHEFDVQDLPYNEDDKWSVSIYSWGI
ncbi:MAG: hypothetical protein RI947_669 [Candidatus Parcubacteria bacterium]|jgi:uncharacterized membrane protein